MDTTSRQPRLLLVGGANPVGSSIDIARLALEEARARGIHTHVTHRAEVLPRIGKVTALADGVSAVDPDDPRASLRWAEERLAAGERFDIVLGLRDTVVEATARIAELMGAPGNPLPAVRQTRNKDACRALLASAGFPQPSVRLCRGVADAEAFLRESGGPWVVKPRDGMGSIGTTRIDGRDDLPSAIAALPDPGLFLVEEFVEGQELSVEGLFLGGEPHVLAVTGKSLFPPPHFVELGHVIPADLPADTARRITSRVRAALTAAGLRFGVFNVELWLTRDGVVLGELHSRPGGDWLHVLLQHAMPGLEMFGPVYDDALGRPVTPPPAATRAGAVRFLSAPAGRLSRVEGWDSATAHPAVLCAEFTAAPGDAFTGTRDSGDRVGSIAVGADTPARARHLVEELAASVEITAEAAPESAPARM
ncbi:ATP-grasp domain-containing protein [Nocardiopsis baichengensis]|uniref:ATP-grasp domain-containing protein n=1 Tax=Nocardiopsis baichengensis TaxID=280240 RepID=UPI000374DE86|nr:ATP-grasp domain-containing protein [Nocardiopsis baichengensis]